MKNKNKRNASDTALVKKTRKKGFNFIDFLLIIFILALVVAAVNIISPMSIISGLHSDSTKTIRYTVEFTCVEKELIDKINENDVVVDSVSKHGLGTVTAVDSSTQYETLEYDEENGKGVLSPHTDKYNVIVTITAQGSYTEGKGYSVNDRRIAVGEKLSMRFPNYVGEGYCIALAIE